MYRKILNNLYYYFMKFLNFFLYVFSNIELPRLPLTSLYLIVTFCMLLSFFYVKIKYPFWNIQPCFHPYDFWRYYSRTPFVIQKSHAPITKFTKLENVRTVMYHDVLEEDKMKCIDLLQCYYIPSENILFQITAVAMQSIMAGTNEGSSLLSFYYDKKYVVDVSNSETSLSVIHTPIGCLLSKPVCLYYTTSSSGQTYEKNPAYLWDFICIHREHQKSKISRNLIQTHDYYQRIKTPDIPISLFKKETELSVGIVPLTKFHTYTYHLKNVTMPKLPRHYSIVRAHKENTDMMLEFLQNMLNPGSQKLFQFCAISNIGNLVSMLNGRNIYIYYLRHKETILAVYVFKDLYTHYEDYESGYAAQLIASINNSNSEDLFFTGFMNSLRELLKNKQKQFQILMIDETSHNKVLLKTWNSRFHYLSNNVTAYYLYNFVFPGSPIASEKCLFIL